jgi:hypothetical protein
LVNLGLTTTLERPDAPPNVFSRSECHPWSASPAYAYLYFVAGIGPGEPGFRTVRMEPQLGNLSFVKGKYPHPSGLITFDLKKSGKDGLKGFVELPAGLTGTFVWRGKEIALRGGRQEIRF